MLKIKKWSTLYRNCSKRMYMNVLISIKFEWTLSMRLVFNMSVHVPAAEPWQYNKNVKSYKKQITTWTLIYGKQDTGHAWSFLSYFSCMICSASRCPISGTSGEKCSKIFLYVVSLPCFVNIFMHFKHVHIYDIKENIV